MIISDNINIYKQNDPLPFQRKNFLSHQMKPVEFSGGNIYHGEWNENYEMDGCGKYFLREEKVLCEGIWEKGELKMARIYYPNGEFYEGEMANSCYNGTGKLINETKDEYIGNFLNGEKSGEGKLIFNDGTIYTGNFMKDSTGKDGAHYNYRYGFCLETQLFPDAVNKPVFPPVTLKPDIPYQSKTVYSFSTIS